MTVTQSPPSLVLKEVLEPAYPGLPADEVKKIEEGIEPPPKDFEVLFVNGRALEHGSTFDLEPILEVVSQHAIEPSTSFWAGLLGSMFWTPTLPQVGRIVSSPEIAKWLASSGMTMGITVVLDVGINFLRRVLKKFFPLNEAKIDLWFIRIERTIGFLGGYTFLLGLLGIIPLPPVGLPALAILLGKVLNWLFGVDEVVSRVTQWITDSLLDLMSKILRIQGAPVGAEEWLRQQIRPACFVRVGVCMHCKTAPRSVISSNCRHLALCSTCAVHVIKCPCGRLFGQRNPVVAREEITCAKKCCMLIKQCDSCFAPATHFFHTERGTRFFRCKRHFDRSALTHYSIAYVKSDCEPPAEVRLDYQKSKQKQLEHLEGLRS